MAAKYATTAELAERWLCSPDYVRMIIREGKLSAVNLGGWKIRWDEVYRDAAATASWICSLTIS